MSGEEPAWGGSSGEPAGAEAPPALKGDAPSMGIRLTDEECASERENRQTARGGPSIKLGL